MSEVSRGARARGFIITNRGSDSEDSDDDDNIYARRSNNTGYAPYSYQPPPLPNPPKPQPSIPTPLTTNLMPTRVPRYQTSHPSLSSPSSTSSPAAEESTPPPSTPGLPPAPVDLFSDGPTSQPSAADLHPVTRTDRNDYSQISTSRTGKFMQTLKSPFHHKPNLPRPPTGSSPRRPATSPTATTPDSFTSSSSYGSTSTASERILVLVTADSERYVNVDITGAKNPAFIRECVFTKLNIYDEEDQSHFSIYQTEIGTFAIGDALSDERLFELCRELGDAKGTLKLLVSHSSASVHEPSSRPASALSPSVNTIPPPVLPHYASYAPLRPKRRSRSRQGSISSASENHPMEPSPGYEADLDNPDRDPHRTTLRPSPHTHHSAMPSPGLPPPSPRRPSAPPRPSSPLSPPSRSNTPPPPLPPPPPPQSLTSNGDRRPSIHEMSTIVDKYGNIVPTPPPPPPLSPNRPTFAILDDNSLTPPANRGAHVRSNSSAAEEREQVLKASEQQMESAGRQWRTQQHVAGRMKPPPEPPRETQQAKDRRNRAKREYEEPLGRADSWVVVGHDEGTRTNGPEVSSSVPHEATRSPVSARVARQHLSPHRYKATSPYTGRPLAIPAPPRKPPPAVPSSSGDTRAPAPPRPQGQPVPANWTVTWKGEEKGDPKPQPSSAKWTRTVKAYKSMDNIRANSSHPANLQPGGGARKSPPQLPMSRTSGNMTFMPGSYGREPTMLSSGQPLSYGSQIRPPLPLQSSPHGTALTFGQTEQSMYGTVGTRTLGYPGGYISPTQEPYPRPSSAFGDGVSSPSQRYPPRHHSPTYGTTLDARTLSPTSQLNLLAGSGSSRSQYSDRSSETPNESQTSHSPPRSPTSPRSPRRPPRSETSPASSTNDSAAESNRSSESTLTREDHGWYAKLLTEQSSEATLIPRHTADENKTEMPAPASSSTESFPTTPWSPYTGDDDSDSDHDDYGTWKKRPTIDRPKSILRGPPLTLQIEDQEGVHPISIPGSSSSTQQSSQLSASPSNRPLNSPSKMGVPQGGTPRSRERGSTFTGREVSSWAPRPPPEDVYERLEEFFPNHDLDKPLIDASSGGTSPTTAEQQTVAPPPTPIAIPQPLNPEKSRMKGKKSIRIVAEEHKKRIDRTSQADASTYTSVARKRSTKLWGSKLEEVTTAQAKGNLGVSLPESPSGGPTTFKWVRGELIGRGTYGRVYLALNATTGEMIAVKQVEIPRTASDKNDSRQVTVVQALKMESETLKDLDHPNIVQYLGFEETPTNLSIFLEYVPGGSIGSCLLKHGKFDEEVTKSFTSQILSGLEYLHSKGILHRDMKADNILVEVSGHCKITDFGISKRTTDQQGAAETAMQGTVFWMAPEVVNPQGKGYNFKVDIWSVGCVVLEMWAGMRPWMGDEAVAVMFKLYQSKLPPPVPEDVTLSELADDFRRKCFAINPEERPSAAELRKHKYLELSPNWVFTGFK